MGEPTPKIEPGMIVSWAEAGNMNEGSSWYTRIVDDVDEDGRLLIRGSGYWRSTDGMYDLDVWGWTLEAVERMRSSDG